MSSPLLRRIILTAYVAVMVLASLFIISRTFSDGDMVQIDDREAVMRRRTTGVLVSLTVDDPVWEPVTISDQEYLFNLSQQINALPRVEGQFPGEGQEKLSGVMEFANGSREEYSISTVLTIGQTVYYSDEVEEALQKIRQDLAARLYTPGNLSHLLSAGPGVILENGSLSAALSSEETGRLCQAVQAGEVVENPQEVSQTVADLSPRFTIRLQDASGTDRLRLSVYANESILVYNTYSSGQRLVLCFSGELVPLCQELLAGD